MKKVPPDQLKTVEGQALAITLLLSKHSGEVVELDPRKQEWRLVDLSAVPGSARTLHSFTKTEQIWCMPDGCYVTHVNADQLLITSLGCRSLLRPPREPVWNHVQIWFYAPQPLTHSRPVSYWTTTLLATSLPLPLPNFLFMFVSSLVKASITGSHCFPSGPRAPMDTPIHGPRNINVDPWCRHGHFQTYFVHCGQCERVLSWFKLVWKRCNEPVPGITYYYVDDSKWWYGICKDCAPEPEDKPPIWRRP